MDGFKPVQCFDINVLEITNNGLELSINPNKKDVEFWEDLERKGLFSFSYCLKQRKNNSFTYHCDVFPNSLPLTARTMEQRIPNRKYVHY